MVTVTTLGREPIDETTAARVADMTGQRANALAILEYRFDEGFTVRITAIPVRYDTQTERQLIHARIGGPIHKQVMALAETLRKLMAERTLNGIPLNVTVTASDLLRAA